MAIDPLMVRNLGGERAYESGPAEVVRDFTYRFRPGSFYELSESEVHAKRLMLQLLGLLTPPKSGEIFVDGARVNDLDLDDLSDIRNRKYGFLFSAPFLLPTFTVLENVAMPLFKIAEVEALEAKAITEEILEMIGASRIANASVEDLQGLDGMLAALARALVHHPRVLIAENVGCNLQENEAKALLSILRESGRRLGLTVIATLASHVSWGLADVCLEIGPRGVKELLRRNPHG
jgi:ABC-type lipoprotein export system ATPase subunit